MEFRITGLRTCDSYAEAVRVEHDTIRNRTVKILQELGAGNEVNPNLYANLLKGKLLNNRLG